MISGRDTLYNSAQSRGLCVLCRDELTRTQHFPHLWIFSEEFQYLSGLILQSRITEYLFVKGLQSLPRLAAGWQLPIVTACILLQSRRGEWYFPASGE